MPSIVGVIPEHIRLRMSLADRIPLGKAAMTMPEIEARAAVKLEKELQEGIANYLRMKGVIFGQSRMDKRTTYTVGWPDFSFVLGGRACFFEVKRQGNKPDPEQVKVIEGLKRAGACVEVVTSLAQAIQSYQDMERSFCAHA